MKEIKVLKAPFTMCNIKHTPSYLPAYSFVISMPSKLTLICPVEDMPKEATNIYETFTCLILEASRTDQVIRDTSELASILGKEDIDMTLVLVSTTAYAFIKADDAMNTIMLLSRLGYDVSCCDFM